MPRPGHGAMDDDAEDMSSWRERVRRLAIRELKNQDIADIFLEDTNYPEYEEPIMNASSSILPEPPEKLRSKGMSS